MTTTAKTVAKTAAKPAAKPATAVSGKSTAKTAEAKPEKQPKPVGVTYRNGAGFVDALKSAKGVAKGNADLTGALNLITHFAWKSPSGAVGWAAGTTTNVTELADDLLIPVGTPIPEAMNAALSAAAKAAKDQPQKDAVKVLGDIIKNHKG